MRRRKRAQFAGVALAALTALAATPGCSKGEDSVPTTSTARPATTVPTPKSVFVEQANAICRDMKVRGNALTSGAASSDPAALAPLFGKMADVVADSANRLRALTPPPGDEATVAAAIDKLLVAGEDTRKVGDAGDDPTAVAAATADQQAAQREADTAMAAYGLTDCVLG